MSHARDTGHKPFPPFPEKSHSMRNPWELEELTEQREGLTDRLIYSPAIFKELVKYFHRYAILEESPPDADPAFKDAVASMMHEAAKKGYDPKNVSFYIPQSSSSGDVDVKEPAENKYDTEHKTRQRELSAKALENIINNDITSLVLEHKSVYPEQDPPILRWR